MLHLILCTLLALQTISGSLASSHHTSSLQQSSSVGIRNHRHCRQPKQQLQDRILIKPSARRRSSFIESENEERLSFLALTTRRLPLMYSLRGGTSTLLEGDDEEEEDHEEEEDDEEEEEDDEEEEEEEENMMQDIVEEDEIVDAFVQHKDDDEEVEDDNEEEGAGEEESSSKSLLTASPVTVLFRTNLGTSSSEGNSIVDTKHEMPVLRHRTVESVKNNLSRTLPGKPPVETIRLIHQGQILRDEQLMDEIFDDEDEDEDEEEEASETVIILDMVPPVEPKFATLLRLPDTTNAELLEAYATNSASMHHNAQQLFVSSNEVDSKEEEIDEDDDEEDTESNMVMLFPKLRQNALRIRESLQVGVSTDVLESVAPSVEAAAKESMAATQVERRGQRVRKVGSGSSIRTSIQREFNVDVGAAIKNILLFLFFGFFGGRSPLSQTLLLLGAPLSILLQTRAIKIILKELFYLLLNPPGLFLSLLPAPQQAILAFDFDKGLQELYGIETKAMDKEEDEDDDEVEEEDDEDDE